MNRPTKLDTFHHTEAMAADKAREHAEEVVSEAMERHRKKMLKRKLDEVQAGLDDRPDVPMP